MKTYISPDPEKAKALLTMSQITHQRLLTTNYNNYPSHTLLDYYDIIHQLLEAFLLQTGIKTKGEGAHKELIELSFEQGTLDEEEKLLIQHMREYRNRISYEGFTIPQQFIKRKQKNIEYLITKLTKQLQKELTQYNKKNSTNILKEARITVKATHYPERI